MLGREEKIYQKIEQFSEREIWSSRILENSQTAFAHYRLLGINLNVKTIPLYTKKVLKYNTR